MDKIKVVICDDMTYICKLYSSMLNNSEICECVGVANNEQESLKLVAERKPDIILLDVQMDAVDSGLKLIPQILEISPLSKIIMISVSNDSENIFKAIKLGAKDYFVKDHPFEDILGIIENVYKGSNKIHSEIVAKIMEHYDIVEKKQESLLYIVNKLMSLSKREMEVLKELCGGASYKEIGQKFYLEEVSVRTTVARMLKKMDYSNISTLIDYINKLGVFSLFENKLGE